MTARHVGEATPGTSHEPATASTLATSSGDGDAQADGRPPVMSEPFLSDSLRDSLNSPGPESETGHVTAGGIAVSHSEVAGLRLHSALMDCPPLSRRSTQLDQLWLTVKDTICTRAPIVVTPLGSSNAVEVTPEHATDELICAMEWLMGHEAAARRLSANALYVKLRGQATRGGNGSARAAQADLLRGLTEVPPGRPVTWCGLDESGAA
jgi:hypothetical protein